MPTLAPPTSYLASATSSASVARVWALLTDLRTYPSWNPFTPRAWGSLEPGERVVLLAKVGPLPMPMVERVESLSEGRELVWGTRWPLELLEARRVQRLVKEEDGGCTYTTEESFTGLLAPLVRLFAGGLVQRGLEATARDLCAAADALGSEAGRSASRQEPS